MWQTVELERRVQELTARDRLVQFQLSYHTQQQAQEEVLRVLDGLLGSDRGVLLQVAEGRSRLEPVAYFEGGQVKILDSEGARMRPPDWVSEGAQSAGEALQHRKAVATEAGTAVALRHHREVLGALWVSPPGGDERVPDVLESLAAQAALVLWKSKVFEKLDTVDVDELLSLR